jgi:hypothetical protein
MKIDLINVAKEVFKDKELIIENLPNNKVKIRYKAPHVTNLKPFVFPEFIELDEEFVEAIGLYVGDGKLSPNYTRHIDFSTTDEDIGKFVLEFFIRLGVKSENMTLQLSYSDGDLEKIKEKWSKILDTPKDKFKTRKHGNNRKDCLHIHINNVIFGKIFRKILYKSLEIIKNHSELRKAFLRGHFAADGGIETRKNRKSIQVSYVTFAYHKSNEVWLRDFIVDCLKREGINCIKIKETKNKQTACIRVGRWENFIIFWKMRLFDRCLRKKELFFNTIRNSNFYLVLNKEFQEELFQLSITQKEIAKIICCNSEGDTCDIIHGKHSLRIEQINNLLKFNGFNWKDVIYNSTSMRFGNVGYVPVDTDFINFILVVRNLV